MTDYTSIEQSIASGKPVELFDIAMGTDHWYMTRAGYDITYLYHDYESVPCKCTELSQSSDNGTDRMELEIPRGHALSVMCIAGAPDQQISLTIYRGHDPYYVKYYTGYLTNFKFNADSIPTLIFESASSDMQFAGGRRRACKQCDLKLYSFRCGVNNLAHEITGTIDTISGVTITATEFGAVATSTPAVYGDLTDLDGCVYAASTVQSITSALGAFDNSLTNNTDVPRHYWESSGSGGDHDQWIYCKWTAAQLIKMIRIYKLFNYGGGMSIFNPRYFRVQGSNNGAAWTNIDVLAWDDGCQLYAGEGGNDTEILFTTDTAFITVTLDNSATYTYYRIYLFNCWGGQVIAILEIEMIEAENSMSVHQFGAGGSIIVGNAERTIIAHNGDEITINRPFRSNVLAGDSFVAYRGCDHTPPMCREVFSNMINFGGRQYMPVKNPYIMRNSLVK